MSNDSILIVGGGIGGLMAAIALSKKGMASIVLEQADQFREAGYGILLCPNVFKVFDKLDMLDEMKKIANFPEHLIWMDEPKGFEYMRVPMGKAVEERFKYPYGSFHREDLLKALVKECKKSPLIKLENSARIKNIEEKEKSVVAISDKGEVYEGKALIGADGLWSVVREYVIGKEKPRISGHVTHRGFITIDRLPPAISIKDVIHWDRPDAHLVQYPVGNRDFFNIVAVYKSKKEHDFSESQGDPEELQERFHDARPEIKELLKFVDTSKKWLLCDREPTKNWSRGKVVLLGDAAHPTLPHLAQGAGMAIEDAAILAKCLSQNKSDMNKAFKQYEEERYLRVAFVQHISALYGKMHDLDALGRDLRNSLISNLSLNQKYDWLAKLYEGIEI